MKIPTAITINNVPLSVKEWNGKRVVTLKDIDMVHGRPKGTARRNFNKNKEHLIEGIDYFVVKPKDVQKNEIRTSEINNRGTTLMTETGYLMLVKSFTDNLAWDVQRQLVNSYFTVQHFRQIPPEPSVLTDEDIRNIAASAKGQRNMEALAKYHLLKAGALIKQAEYEMAQGDLLQLVKAHPWLAETDNVLRLEENA